MSSGYGSIVGHIYEALEVFRTLVPLFSAAAGPYSNAVVARCPSSFFGAAASLALGNAVTGKCNHANKLPRCLESKRIEPTMAWNVHIFSTWEVYQIDDTNRMPLLSVLCHHGTSFPCQSKKRPESAIVRDSTIWRCFWTWFHNQSQSSTLPSTTIRHWSILSIPPYVHKLSSKRLHLHLALAKRLCSTHCVMT